jgi:hypothetical protein
VWVGGGASGTATIAGSVTIDNPGTESAFPRFVIARSGGTTATIRSIRNETLGLTLLFDYSIIDSETIIADLRSERKTITSDFFGAIPNAILANSDFGSFNLASDTNQITAFVDVSGVPTINAFVLWRSTYWSQD